MKKITIYGKGGIGKSVVSSHLSAAYASMGYKVLQVGCDPKADSTLKLLKEKKARTVVSLIEVISKSPKDEWKDKNKMIDYIINPGKMGIDCIEAGGPEPGIGCGGRGIIFLFEVFEEVEFFEKHQYDVVIYDVLGDVVCGGFATPISKGIGEKVFVVMSEELMSLYAANNIAKAVMRYHKNDISLGGLIVNLRDNSVDKKQMDIFADALNTRIVKMIPRDPLIREAEAKRQTTIEYAPDSQISQVFRELAEQILEDDSHPELPTVMDEDQFNAVCQKMTQPSST